MKNIVSLILVASALALVGCSTLNLSPTRAQKSAIESAFAHRTTVEREQVNFLNGERIAGLMAIDVHRCPPDFRSAWYDYLVKVQSLHTRVERVAGIAQAVGHPVSDLPSLIKFTSANPEVGQYLMAELGKVDDAWSQVERIGMNYGIMPKVASRP